MTQKKKSLSFSESINLSIIIIAARVAQMTKVLEARVVGRGSYSEPPSGQIKRILKLYLGVM